MTRRHIIEPSWDMYADLDTNGTQLDPWHQETARERVGMIYRHEHPQAAVKAASVAHSARKARVRARRVQFTIRVATWIAITLISLSMWWAIIWLAWAVYTAVQ